MLSQPFFIQPDFREVEASFEMDELAGASRGMAIEFELVPARFMAFGGITEMGKRDRFPRRQTGGWGGRPSPGS